MVDRTEFELEVVERLARLEIKIDSANGTVKKVCADVEVLKKESIIQKAQWDLMKKLSALTVGLIGVVATVVPILVAAHII